MEVPILKEAIIILVASIVVFYISHRLRLPAVTGFILTGILIGPGGIGLIHDTHSINILAEIGVVMLLFTIGLDISFERLGALKKNFWVGGGFQICLTILIAFGVLQVFTIPVNEAIFYGFLISLSSTALVLKIYSDSNQLESPQGNISLGILLFQDISLVPMIVITPLLVRAGDFSLTTVLARFFFGILAVIAVVIIARYLMPRILYLIVKTRVREIFLITSLFLCLGMAFLTSSLGLSLALGAFLAGIIISESEYSYQVTSEIMPFKDLFISLFFISIGLLLNLKFAWNAKFTIFSLVIIVIFLKALIVFFVVKIMRYPTSIALVSGLGLAQIGEFSFVLANVGKTIGLISEEIFQIFIASSIMTILATPFLFQISSVMVEKTGKILNWKWKPDHDLGKKAESLKNHVIIGGYGLNGRNLVRVLKETGIPYVIIELNPDTIRKTLQEGEMIIFGDISSREVLKAAEIKQARVVVFAISDPKAIKAAVKIAREMNAKIHIIVRVRFVTEIDELYKLGANQIIPEEFETSIEIFARVLREFHLPRNIINAQINLIRSESYGVLRCIPRTRRFMEKISDLLKAGTTETFLVHRNSPAVGKSLNELDVRRKTGATIIAIVREEKFFTSPSPELEIKEGDTLVLIASHADMDRVFTFLSSSSNNDAGI
ncbi:MAG TPA: cation:proton antiporter [Acidobacteriota bacterium]|nr:cation:proton antiporter [Acidobacteriota bacterium]